MYSKHLADIGEEPLTLVRAKEHLRLDPDDTSEDGLLNTYIKAARRTAEHYTGLVIRLSRYEQTGDSFIPKLTFAKHPIKEVESVVWGDYTYPADSYYYIYGTLYLPRIDNLVPALNAAKVTYIAGYETVPEDIEAAMLLILGHLYANRESVVVAVSATELPMGAKFLLDPYRRLNI